MSRAGGADESSRRARDQRSDLLARPAAKGTPSRRRGVCQRGAALGKLGVRRPRAALARGCVRKPARCDAELRGQPSRELARLEHDLCLETTRLRKMSLLELADCDVRLGTARLHELRSLGLSKRGPLLKTARLQSFNVPQHLLCARVVSGPLVLVGGGPQKLHRASLVAADLRRLSGSEILSNVARHSQASLRLLDVGQ